MSLVSGVWEAVSKYGMREQRGEDTICNTYEVTLNGGGNIEKNEEKLEGLKNPRP